MTRFHLTPYHLRVLDVLSIGERAELHELMRRANLKLHEVLVVLFDLVSEGYLQHEGRRNERGGMERIYTRLAEPARMRTETVERDPDADEVRPLTYRR